MPYNFAYQLFILNVEDVPVTVNIYDTLSGSGSTTFYTIEGSEDDALIIETADNNESKFTPIKAKKATIKFLSNSVVNLNSFIGSVDNRWYVEVLVNTNYLFKGFLILDDIDEDFLDPDTANTVTLVATDNIAALKDVAMTKPDGTNPRGYFNIITYIAWCLKKTGLDLPLNVVHNVMEEHTPGVILYESGYLQSKTFEQEINESVDCYAALEMILSEDAFLTQSNGEWWIIRIDEMQDDAFRVSKYNADGVYQSTNAYNPVQVFGPNEAICFANNATLVKVQAAVKSAKITYNYTFPKEIVDNIDFSRGDIFGILTQTPTEKRYHLEDWANGALGSTLAISPFIYRGFNSDGYETSRYVVLGVANTDRPIWIRSSAIPISQLDKISFAVDWNLNENLSGSGIYSHVAALMLLEGEDGSFWGWNNTPFITTGNRWRTYNGDPNDAYNSLQMVESNWNPDATDESKDWITASTSTQPAPVSGNLYIYLLSFVSPNFGAKETHYSNLRINYIPYINGTYTTYIGQTNTITQNLSTKKAIDEEVKISDSPKKLFKGALFYNSGSIFKLIGRVYDGRQYPTTLPPEENRHPFGYNQAYCVFNQINRPFRVFDFEAQGLNAFGITPDIIHKYTVNETTPHTTHKYFMLMHYELNVKLCELKGVMAEVWDTTLPKDYLSPLDFKYTPGQ